VKLRIRRRAKKELLDVDDDAIFFALVKAMLNLGENPWPRGYDKVEGAGGVYGLPALLTALQPRGVRSLTAPQPDEDWEMYPPCDIDKA
jgi:hypothetical protein